MLSPPETKAVLTTLTKRRAWLRKTLEDSSLDPAARKEHTEILKLLESSMQKLAASQKNKPISQSSGETPSPDESKPRKSINISNARILVADDQKASAEVLISLLNDIGVTEIEIATNGRDAFDKIKNTSLPYDIILCDWDMPELSGIEVHQKALASNTLRGAHFCMVTGITEAKKIREAIQQGVNDYVVKPVDAKILEEKVKAAIQAKAET